MTYTVQFKTTSDLLTVLTRGSSITTFLQRYKILSYASIPYKRSTALASFSIETMVDKVGVGFRSAEGLLNWSGIWPSKRVVLLLLQYSHMLLKVL